MTPFVTVVIPNYNYAHFLSHALQSVIDQTYKNWEAIVIDNYSQDDTEVVVRGFKDPRISLKKIRNNGLIAASRNMGIREARGEWIAFLDSDDGWYPQKLELCLKKIEEGYDAICHGQVWVNERDRHKKLRNVYFGPESRATFDALLFDGNCISTSAFIVNRSSLEAVGGFEECKELITAEDYHLWLKLAHAGMRVGFVKEILGEYRIHADNNSKSALQNILATRRVFENTYAEWVDQTFITQIKAWRRRAIIDYGGGRILQDNGDHLRAWPWFLKAILRWPFIPKFYAAMVLNALCYRVG